MANPYSNTDVLAMVRKQLQEAHPDVLRAVLTRTLQELMWGEAEALCGAEYGERSEERVNSRNGYRPRVFDTRIGIPASLQPALADVEVVQGLEGRVDDHVRAPSRSSTSTSW